MNEETFQVHPAAAEGFEKAPEIYENARPDFPPESISFIAQTLNITPDIEVLDLAAGTGKLTRCLLPLGARLTAVEPVGGMRRKFVSMLPDVRLIAGTAEAIPLPNASVDVVLVATAFHWFNGPEALAEIARVLKPGGRLGLLWNVRDESAEWFAGITRLIEPYEGNVPRYKTFRWKKAFDQTSLFTPLQQKEFPFFQKGNLQTVLDRVKSISFIAALDREQQDGVIDAVTRYLESQPEFQNEALLDIPYRTTIYWCSKK